MIGAKNVELAKAPDLAPGEKNEAVVLDLDLLGAHSPPSKALKIEDLPESPCLPSPPRNPSGTPSSPAKKPFPVIPACEHFAAARS